MVRLGGANPNNKTVVINPPGVYHNGGANENLTPAVISFSYLEFEDSISRKHKDFFMKEKGIIYPGICLD